MGNKLSCSCAPLIRKAYRYEDSPWQNSRKKDGHLLRLWAEVFHVSSSTGAAKWQQVSEDLVPVNITCIQDTPECVFHITAYNSQVEKILDVRLVQPGTRLGQASECFVYWKDPSTGDTWGLNFTSPVDAKQFKECCSPDFKFSRKASSSYSLKLEPPKQQVKVKANKKVPQSTPSSPSKGREPRCTCAMTIEQMQRARDGRARYAAAVQAGMVPAGSASTLPRSQSRTGSEHQALYGRLSAHPSSQSVYDNVSASLRGATPVPGAVKQTRSDVNLTTVGHSSTSAESQGQFSRSELARAKYAAQVARRAEDAKSVDYGMGMGMTVGSSGTNATAGSGDQGTIAQAACCRSRSKSTDNVCEKTAALLAGASGLSDGSLKRPLSTVPSVSSMLHGETDRQTPPSTSGHHHQRQKPEIREKPLSGGGTKPVTRPKPQKSGTSSARPSKNGGTAKSGTGTPSVRNGDSRRAARGSGQTVQKSPKQESGKRKNKATLEVQDRERSPPSDNLLYDNMCYATTPSSSNENSDVAFPSSEEDEEEVDDIEAAVEAKMHKPMSASMSASVGGGVKRKGAIGEGRAVNSLRRPSNAPATNSPTSKLLMEYEMHLRNALARGLDAESYSLHTFEALLTQSMENVVALMREVHVELEEVRKEEQALRTKDEPEGSRVFANARVTTTAPKTNTLPLPGSTRQPPHLAARGENPCLMQRSSMESTDSRIYLTSSEMSDDDRLSLTTAVSDEEEPDTRTSSYRTRTGAAAASFNCTGAVRKAGFLSVKKWLLRKRQQVELARKRGWKGYWVCLKGTTLLFYPCDNRDGRAIDTTPKHLIIVDGAIMQPIPEHPKRDFIFCLSTAFGDAYLFQAPCQVELENWINSIHSACAAAFARHRGKTGTLHLLQEEIFRLEREIESDSRMKHMAELQLTVVADSDSRGSLTSQISQWEESLERLHCEQFRLRCYMASLQNSELPNPKSLLTHVSKGTKSTLNKLGVFTVSSFHAFICARSPSLLTNLLSGRGATKRRARQPLSRSNSSKRSLSLLVTSGHSGDVQAAGGRAVKILLPEAQSLTLCVKENMTVEDVLWAVCCRKQLAPTDHFLHIKQDKESQEYFVPSRDEIFESLKYDDVELCAKVLYQVELHRNTLEHLFGFSVEAELIENADHQDELCVYVSRVEENSQAYEQGIIKGDEIMVINGAIVSDLDMMYIESVLQEELTLCMMMRSARREPPDIVRVVRTSDDYIESLVCPPPPSDNVISEEMIDKLIVPSPLFGADDRDKSPETSGRPTPSPTPIPQQNTQLSAAQIETLLKTAEQVTEYCRTPLEQRRLSGLGGSTGSSASGSTGPFVLTTVTTATPSRHLTEAEKLRKVITELVETEKTYVKRKNYCCDVQSLLCPHEEHLNSLLEHYLEPMKKETFLSNSEVNNLFGNIQEIVQFQRVFLQSLEEAIASEPDFDRFDHPCQFQNVLFSLGNSFLYYADQFKLYSSFCASHSKAQKVLHPGKCKGVRNKDHVAAAIAGDGNSALMEFLQSRNPKGQHSFSLESYLIKPIQRILKYPLLLQQLKHLTEPNSQEHLHLSEALKGMERVAEHINEMQRIHEEYGAIFEHLSRQHFKSSRQHVDLSPGELLYYGGVEWLNISEFLGKIKKGLELHAMCFVFKAAVVFLCKERIRQKKKLMGGSSKAGTTEVEIIRYQVLIPVTEVQVRAGCVKDGDSHFLWELIHLRSQLQRRSEKVYQLSNSTSEFRNAFLRTIRQIIRESVRNMTVPVNKPTTKDKQGQSGGGGRRGPDATAASGMARTLSGKRRSKTTQRHSAGNMDQDSTTNATTMAETYDNVDQNFHTRSKTVTDGLDDMTSFSQYQHHHHHHSTGHHHHHHGHRESGRGHSPPTHHHHSQTDCVKQQSTGTSTITTGSGVCPVKLVPGTGVPQPFTYLPGGLHPGEKAGSPIWKPRENSFDKSSTLPNPGKSRGGGGGGDPPSSTAPTSNTATGKEQYIAYDEYHGYGTSAKTEHAKAQPDC